MVFSLNKYFTHNYSWKHITLLVSCAFLVRALTFGFYVQHEERYFQADSNDYNFCAGFIKSGNGMTRFDTQEPIFWRTPGYPLYLSLFYYLYDINSLNFSQNTAPQKASIWFQIFLCSFIPLLIFFLMRALTSSLLIAWIGAWLSVFHVGFVLASCYILSDALAQIFFIGFLYFFYKSFTFWFEPNPQKKIAAQMLLNICIAACSLGLYTWLRPNGQFIVVLGTIIILLGRCSWKNKLKKTSLFLLVFFTIIGGWYVRNYQLTGHAFFCPMLGPYLQSFCAPKIIRRISQRPLEDCMRYLMGFVMSQTNQETERAQKEIPRRYVSKERICLDIAAPWIKNYPSYFIYDWTKEVLKTTFDLYASQLVAMANNTHKYDPLEEFLSEKVALCLYKQPMGRFMRLICWFEFLFSILLWLGLIGGLVTFVLMPLFLKTQRNKNTLLLNALWIKTGLLIGGMLVMTGGFGYARLRMPIDPLLFLLSLTFWYYMYKQSRFIVRQFDKVPLHTQQTSSGKTA